MAVVTPLVVAAASTFLTALHVGYVLRGRVALPLVATLATLAVPTFAWGLLPRGGTWRHWWGTGIEFAVPCAALAWVGGVFDAYAAAFVCAPLFVYVLVVGHRRGLVCYDPTTVQFVLTRSCMYASLRAVGEFSVRRFGASRAVDRLLPLAVATAETAGMYAFGYRTTHVYTFGAHTPAFAAYTATKWMIMALVPLLDEALRVPWEAAFR